MKAGRELDALVAEKVIGCSVSTVLAGCPEFKGIPFCGCVGAPHHSFQTFRENGDKTPIIKPYSTDIAAAWDVAEKVGLFRRAQLWALDDGRWFVGDFEDQLEILGEGLTAPHAICLAALKAVNAL